MLVTHGRQQAFPDTDLKLNILKLITRQHLIGEKDRVLMAFSGGIDSATLFFILHEIRKIIPFGLGAAHVNHLLRGEESDRDEAFTRNASEKYGVPYYLKRVDVKSYARSRGLSAQHAGRDIRYGFFNEIAEKEGFTKVAIAHTLDDQVETFLLRLAKGTGIRGLTSIPPVRDRIIRPYLTTYRSEIEAFATSHHIEYVADSSNQKTKYERNFVRHKVIPVLKELNPSVGEKIISLLGDVSKINEIFETEKNQFMTRHVHKNEDHASVSIGDLTELSEETRFRVLSDVVAGFIPVVLLREHMHLIEKVIFSDRPNLILNLPSSVRIIRAYDRLEITMRPSLPKTKETFSLHEGINPVPSLGITVVVETLDKAPLSYPDDKFTAYLDAGQCGDLALRTFQAGDRFVPLGMAQPVKIKDFFISRKISREERYRIPLLLSGPNIVWVAGHRINDRYKVTIDTHKVLKVTVENSCQPSSVSD